MCSSAIYMLTTGIHAKNAEKPTAYNRLCRVLTAKPVCDQAETATAYKRSRKHLVFKGLRWLFLIRSVWRVTGVQGCSRLSRCRAGHREPPEITLDERQSYRALSQTLIFTSLSRD